MDITMVINMIDNMVNKYGHNLLITVQWHISEKDTAGNKATALYAHGLVANCSTDIAGSGATNWLPIPYWFCILTAVTTSF